MCSHPLRGPFWAKKNQHFILCIQFHFFIIIIGAVESCPISKLSEAVIVLIEWGKSSKTLLNTALFTCLLSVLHQISVYSKDVHGNNSSWIK